jgi:hypothetical protein
LRVQDTVEEALLGLVGPGAVAAAERQIGQRREQVREFLKRDLEAALRRRYAFRQYDSADPANRLMAGELEALRNRALAHVAEVESNIAAHGRARPGSTADPAPLATLATI